VPIEEDEGSRNMQEVCEKIDPYFLTAFFSLEFEVEMENTVLFITG
jgi:hypothetical protein